MPPFTFRPATTASSDPKFLADCWNSQIPWLTKVGSAGQWGTQTMQESRPESLDKILSWVQRSESKTAWGPDWCRAFIAEVANDQQTPVPVGALVLEATSAEYVRSILPEQDGERPFVYLTYLITDRRVGELQKGAGAALVAFAREQVRGLAFHRLCVDCWRGNGGKLVK